MWRERGERREVWGATRRGENLYQVGQEGMTRARCLSVEVTTREVRRVGWEGDLQDSNQRLGTVAGDCMWRVQQRRERTTGRTRRERGTEVNSGDAGMGMGVEGNTVVKRWTRSVR